MFYRKLCPGDHGPSELLFFGVTILQEHRTASSVTVFQNHDVLEQPFQP